MQTIASRTRRGVALAVAVLGVAALLGAAALAAALQPEPAVALQADPDENDVARALALLRTHDPRHAAPGVVSTAQIGERDLDVLLNHAFARGLDATARIAIEQGSAVLNASVHLAPNPFGRWLNVHARLAGGDGLPAIDSVTVGALPLPAWLARRVALALAARSGAGAELDIAAGVVRRVAFIPQQMQLVYAWHADSAERMLAVLLPQPELQRLRAYNERLVALAAAAPQTETTSLAPLVGPLFALAQQRSAGGDATAENRAALVVLALFANGRAVADLTPAARAWPRARPLRLTLAGRDDFALHLLVSAALAVEGTGPLAKAIGVYKELADARGGSGFSFNDMAANRAGSRLGELAAQHPRQLQAQLARGVQEADFMPLVADLPEFMPEPEFKRRFGGVGAPAYAAMMGEIERRVGALPVLR